MARRLFPLADRVILTRPHSERALVPHCLRSLAGANATNVEIIEDPGLALRRALSLAGPEDLVCAAGSLYLVGDIKKLQRNRKTKEQTLFPGGIGLQEP
jgi:dihydrofolate synthase/folylpolyglutamate synthase